MSDLIGNPNCWFSHAKAHLKSRQRLDWLPFQCDISIVDPILLYNLESTFYVIGFYRLNYL